MVVFAYFYNSLVFNIEKTIWIFHEQIIAQERNRNYSIKYYN